MQQKTIFGNRKSENPYTNQKYQNDQQLTAAYFPATLRMTKRRAEIVYCIPHGPQQTSNIKTGPKKSKRFINQGGTFFTVRTFRLFATPLKYTSISGPFQGQSSCKQRANDRVEILRAPSARKPPHPRLLRGALLRTRPLQMWSRDCRR